MTGLLSLLLLLLLLLWLLVVAVLVLLEEGLASFISAEAAEALLLGRLAAARKHDAVPCALDSGCCCC